MVGSATLVPADFSARCHDEDKPVLGDAWSDASRGRRKMRKKRVRLSGMPAHCPTATDLGERRNGVATPSATERPKRAGTQESVER